MLTTGLDKQNFLANNCKYFLTYQFISFGVLERIVSLRQFF